MTLEIIGAGFGRTGTLSVCTALNQLGYPCYHMTEVLENRRNRSHLGFWRRVSEGAPGDQHPWEEVFADYRATMDNPGCCVWRELLDAHPAAKVVLTLHPRGAEAWYASTVETIYAPEKMWQFRVLTWLMPTARTFRIMSQQLIWQRSHRGTMGDRERAIAHYHRHVEEVKAAVPPERLLVFSADQGWGPLCAFLGLPEPATPFPNVNDRKEILRKFDAVARGVYIGLGLLAALLAASVYEAAKLLS